MSTGVTSFIGDEIMEVGEQDLADNAGKHPIVTARARADESVQPSQTNNPDANSTDSNLNTQWSDVVRIGTANDISVNPPVTTIEANNLPAVSNNPTLTTNNMTQPSRPDSNNVNIDANFDNITSRTFKNVRTVSSRLSMYDVITDNDIVQCLVDMDLIDSVQATHVNFRNNYASITFTSRDAMHRFFEKDFVVRGETIDWSPLHTTYRTVSLMSVPNEIPDEYPIRQLSQYGTVVGNRRKYKKVLGYELETVTRIYKIALRKDIPRSIKICGYETRVIYTGQPNIEVCSKCKGPHHRSDCTERCSGCGSMFHHDGHKGCDRHLLQDSESDGESDNESETTQDNRSMADEPETAISTPQPDASNSIENSPSNPPAISDIDMIAQDSLEESNVETNLPLKKKSKKRKRNRKDGSASDSANDKPRKVQPKPAIELDHSQELLIDIPVTNESSTLQSNKSDDTITEFTSSDDSSEQKSDYRSYDYNQWIAYLTSQNPKIPEGVTKSDFLDNRAKALIIAFKEDIKEADLYNIEKDTISRMKQFLRKNSDPTSYEKELRKWIEFIIEFFNVTKC